MSKLQANYTFNFKNKKINIEKKNLVALVRVENYDSKNLQQGIKRIFELINPKFLNENFKNKKILLKPNVLAPDKLAYTNKNLIEEIGIFLQQKGANNILIGDSTMTKAITSMAHKRSGMAKVSEKFGKKMVNFLADEYVTISHDSFKASNVIRIPKTIIDVDIIINLPKLKTHFGYVFTGAIKNFFGLMKDKINLHNLYKDKIQFQRMLGDIHNAVLCTGKNGDTKQVLHIMDAIVAMEGKGPRSGDLKPFNCLIASFSPVALDSVAYSLMGGNPNDLESIRSLSERNDWPSSVKDLVIIGDYWEKFKQKAKLPPLTILKTKRTAGSVIERLAVPILNSFHHVIKINNKKCIKCMTCVKNCPTQAMTLNQKQNKMNVNYNKCINCFCCGEACPKSAISHQRIISKAIANAFHSIIKPFKQIRDNFKISGDLRASLGPSIGLSFKGWIKLFIIKGYGSFKHYFPRVFLLNLFSLLQKPFIIKEHLKYNKLLKNLKFRSYPIFIIGHWRTGTTHLQNLLSKDPNLGYLSQLQATFPKSFIDFKVLQNFLKKYLPETRPMDNMTLGVFSPTEEEMALGNLFPYSFYNGFYLPEKMMENYDNFIRFKTSSHKMVERWKKQYITLLKKTTYYNRGKRLILKNPANTSRIKYLLDLFPEAKFIHIYRNPFEVFPSTFNFYKKAIQPFMLQDISDNEIKEIIFNIYIHMMSDYFKDKELIPEGNLVEIRFEDLEANPIGELERIYNLLNIAGYDIARPHFETYIKSIKSYKKNTYKIPKELIKEIKERWGLTIAKWNYSIP